MLIQVVDTRGEQIIFDLKVSSDTTLDHIKEQLCELWPSRQRHRQHLYKMPERLLLAKDEATLKEVGITESCTLMVKDIGPQVSQLQLILGASGSSRIRSNGGPSSSSSTWDRS